MSGLTVARRAQIIHRCGGGGHRIQPGDVYLMHTQFPGSSDSCYANAAGHPVINAECAACATRYGRGPLIEAYGKQVTVDNLPADR